MNYGSQTIQQQGRVFQVREETQVVTSEHGQGKGWKMGKNRSWKHVANCKHCGVIFPGRAREKNDYCTPDCFNEFRVMKWLPCSICMAAIGLGSQGAGKLLRVADSSVRKNWKRRGIKSERPKSGSIINEGRMIAGKLKQEDQAKLKQYEKAWMDEISSHRDFPDWSSIASKELREKWLKKRGSQYSLMTPEQKAHHNSNWRNRCPIKRSKSLRAWKKARRESDPTYAIIESFRSRLSMIARGKTMRTKELIGCSTKEFQNHLERNFKRGMTWENYGRHWHVDHTLPVSSFDHKDPNQLKQCWHWTNLKPMTATKNLRKGARITEPQMELLLCTH